MPFKCKSLLVGELHSNVHPSAPSIVLSAISQQEATCLSVAGSWQAPAEVDHSDCALAAAAAAAAVEPLAEEHTEAEVEVWEAGTAVAPSVVESQDIAEVPAVEVVGFQP